MGNGNKKTNKFLIFLAFIFGVVATYFAYNYMIKNNIVKINKKNITTTTIEEVSDFKNAIGEIYDAVVYIETRVNDQAVAAGSGFIYKKDENSAYVLTNYHVIEDGDNYRVTLSSDIELEATYVNGDQYYDIAVLKIDSKDVTKVATLKEPSKIELGDSVFAVGSPLGKDYMGTITKGIISGINRMVTVKIDNQNYLMEVMQTDAPINSGNSGGPLCNIKGEVIGISSSKIKETGVEGIGFAIPIDSVKAILNDIEQGKKIERPYLGIQLVDMVNKQIFEYRYNVKVSDKTKYGAIVGYIEEGKTADIGGLKVGDVIIEMDNKKITDVSHFIFEIFKHKKGDKVKIKYYRGDDIKEVTLNLSETIKND